MTRYIKLSRTFLLRTFLVLLILAGAGRSVAENPVVEKYISGSIASFKKQIQQNRYNNLHGLRGANKYVLDLSGLLVGKSGNVEKYFNEFTPTPAFVNRKQELNDYLIKVNEELKKGGKPEIYIGLHADLGFIIVKKKLDDAYRNKQQYTNTDIENASVKEDRTRIKNIQQLFDKVYTDIATGVQDDIAIVSVGLLSECIGGESDKVRTLFKAGLLFANKGMLNGAGVLSKSEQDAVIQLMQFKPAGTSQDELYKGFVTYVGNLQSVFEDPDKLADLGLPDGSLGKRFYDRYKVKADSAKNKIELVKLAKLVDKVGETFYNTIVSGEMWDNSWESTTATTISFDHYLVNDFSAENIRNAYNEYKRIYDEFESLKSKADYGNVTKSDVLAFCKNLIYGVDKKYFFYAPFEAFTLQQRKTLLTALSQGNITGRWSISGDAIGEEDAILALLMTTPDEDRASILYHIRDNRLLYLLVKGIDGANFIQFVSILNEWLIKSKDANLKPPALFDAKAAIENKKYLQYNDSYFGRVNHQYIQQDGKLHLTVRKLFHTSEEYTIDADPYEYVWVKFKNNFTIANSGFVSGENYKLPSIFTYLLFNEDQNRKWLKTGRIVLDVGLCVLSAGEITALTKAVAEAGTATNYSRLFLAAADMGLVVGDMVINAAFQIEIKQKYPRFYENWEKISLCYGVGRLTQIGIEGVYNQCRNDLSIMKTEVAFTEETKQTVVQMENALKNREEFGEFIDEYNNLVDQFGNFARNVKTYYPNVYNKFSSWEKALQEKFVLDFGNKGNILTKFNDDEGLIDIWSLLSEKVAAADRVDLEFLGTVRAVADDPKFYPHIEGEINPDMHGLPNENKGGRGGHIHQSILDGKIRYSQSTRQKNGVQMNTNPPDVDITTHPDWYNATTGCRKAWIDVWDDQAMIWKFKESGASTFYPIGWDKQRIIEEVASAIKEAKQSGRFGGVNGKTNLFEGVSTSGIKIQGFINVDRSSGIATTWPLLR